ncbi:unnamed protein product [Rhizopus stolonifer]
MKYVKTGSSINNGIVHKAIITCLKSMMWERSKPAFTAKLAAFIQQFGEYTSLIRYLKTYYFDNDAFMRWTACYQIEVYTNMETNNYVESWHNQLKTTYLRRKQNRRVDGLIFILVKDIEYDYQNNVKRLMLNVGRMSPEQRRMRTRQISAEIILHLNCCDNPTINLNEYR